MTITIMFCFFVWNPEPGAKNKALQIGDKLPGFFLKNINGNSFFLDEYVGEKAKNSFKALIFSLSASYCKPCKKEIPELGKLMGKYKDKGLRVFIIALEKEERARTLIAETKTTIPVLIDKHLLVPKLLGHEGIPFTILVDEEGTVRYINTGFSEKNVDRFMERFENEIMAVLGLDNSGSDEQEKQGNNL